MHMAGKSMYSKGPFSRIYLTKTQSNKIKSACVVLAKTINMQMAALCIPRLTATTEDNFQLHKLLTTNPADDAFHKQRSSPTSQTKYSPLAFISAPPSLFPLRVQPLRGFMRHAEYVSPQK